METINNIWELFRTLLPSGLLQVLLFLALTAVILAASKFRNERWYLPLWLGLASILFVPFVLGVEGVTADMPRHTIIPNVLFIFVYKAVLALPACPLVLLGIFYPRKGSFSLPIFVASVIIVGTLGFSVSTYARKTLCPTIQVRAVNPEGKPLAGFKVSLEIHTLVPSGKDTELKRVSTKREAVSDREGMIPLPEWGFSTLWVTFGAGKAHTKYFVHHDGTHEFIPVLVSWPLFDDTENRVIENQYLCKIDKKMKPFKLVIPVPDASGREERYEAAQYRRMLAENPPGMYPSGGYEFPTNSVLLQHIELVRGIGDETVRKEAVGSALKMLNAMIRVVEGSLQPAIFSGDTRQDDVKAIAGVFGDASPDRLDGSASGELLATINAEIDRWKEIGIK